MAQKSRQNEEKLDELESELSRINESLLEAKNGREEAEARILELKGIIQQKESELISINETMESRNSESESQRQELTSKTEHLEKELQNMEHKLLEVESELEFTKTSLENVDAEKKDVNTRVEKALEEKQLLEEKLRELKTSFENQRAVLDNEIDEIRESLLNEKELVFDLEDKVLCADKIKHAAEAKLRVSKKEMEDKMSAIANSENELRQELEKEKERSVQLESQVERLTEERMKWESIEQSKTIALEEEKKTLAEGSPLTELRQELEKEKATNLQLESRVENITVENQQWESLAESKAIALEEEKKQWKEEVARLVGQFEEEKKQLLEQLREISALKVKESEDCYTEKNERIKELETKLATAAKNTEDYEQSIQHYQLKLAKAEYELETTVARLSHLEKQVIGFLVFRVLRGTFGKYRANVDRS